MKKKMKKREINPRRVIRFTSKLYIEMGWHHAVGSILKQAKGKHQ
jgi:hypothetical protein